MKIPGATAKRRARIEIIPLIDIVFFLLATFVMVSMSMVKNQGIAVHLPEAQTGSPSKDTAWTTITVTEDNRLYVDKEQIAFDALPAHLKEIKTHDRDPKVLVNGDRGALFGSAVKVLDEVRRSGITTISIQTESPQASAK